jgi:hypothetical protein
MLYDLLEEIYPALIKLFGVDTPYCPLVNRIVHNKGNVHSISVFKGYTYMYFLFWAVLFEKSLCSTRDGGQLFGVQR